MLLAVNDDMPFLFDSLLGEITAQGARVRALFHPIMTVTRDADGLRAQGRRSCRESVIVLTLEPSRDADARRLVDGAREFSRKCGLPCATGARCWRGWTRPLRR